MILNDGTNWRVCAIIVAGGAGLRMGGEIPKQYLPLGSDGAPILAWSIHAFNRTGIVDEIILVVPESDCMMVRRDIVAGFAFEKVREVVPGGATRQESTAVGVEAVKSASDTTVVLVHDGVRPFVDEAAIVAAANMAAEQGAALVARPVTDTIKRLNDQGLVVDTVRRDTLLAAQTPQAFQLGMMRAAIETARNDGFEGTDECMLVERLGIAVPVIEGDTDNLKITTQQDMTIAREIARRREGPIRASESLKGSGSLDQGEAV